MKLRVAFSVGGACWLGACSFPDYGFVAEPSPPPPIFSICSDGQPSEAETGIDCGGGCLPCALGAPCEIPDDCVTLACFGGLCVMPGCDDGLKNGAESDRDCGGECDVCLVGQDCRVDEDCETRVCAQGLCRAAECSDGVQNGSETSMDCGGLCDPCGLGAACVEGGDCISSNCAAQICVSPGCTDGALNGDETDSDCGGGECGPCAAGEGCLVAPDCESLICDLGLHCTAPSCNDDVLNGDESDLDCGGGCPGCEDLERCDSPDDCASMTCQSGLCVPGFPSGNILSREGWNASASQTHENDTPNDALSPAGVDGNSWSSGGDQVVGMFYEMDMGELQAFFSIQMECMVEYDAPLEFAVFLSQDGDFSDEQPVREEVPGFPLTNVEFATAQVARYIRVELTLPKQNWWCIDDFRVYD